ncbi:MAG: hypothetical protein ACOH5I_03465 [Oligoflexus sp.]
MDSNQRSLNQSKKAELKAVINEFIVDHREAVINRLDSGAYERAFHSWYRFIIVGYPLLTGVNNYLKANEPLDLILWGSFAAINAILIGVGSFSKKPNYAKHFLNFVIFTVVAISSLMVAYVESRGYVTRGGPVQLALIAQVFNPFFISRKYLVWRGVALALMPLTITYFTYSPYASVLIGQLLIGSLVSIAITIGLQRRELEAFYITSLKEQENQHFAEQLKRTLYQHQLAMIKTGSNLEETMPLEKGRAVVCEFDIKNSSNISSPMYEEAKRKVLSSIYEKFIYRSYEVNPLKMESPISEGYRIKELGDGFIYSVGHPFRTTHKNQFDLAVDISIGIVTFSKKAFFYRINEKISFCISIVSSDIQGFWSAAPATQFDFEQDGITKVFRLSELRRKLESSSKGWRGKDMVLITQAVYDELEARKENFSKIDLAELGITFRGAPSEAFVYVHLFD